MYSKLSLAVVAGLAAVGQATHHNKYAHLHHRRALNATSSAAAVGASSSNGDILVTSTVFTTSEITIISCHPTVT